MMAVSRLLKFVSDAAGKPADGLHFLRLCEDAFALTQSLLGHFVLGNIVHASRIILSGAMRQPPTPGSAAPRLGTHARLRNRERLPARTRPSSRSRRPEVPTYARQRINDLPLGFQRRHLKGAVKGSIRHPDPQIRIQHQ